MIITCEQVSKYHPDKYADQISDAILDACLWQDPNARVACECMVKDNTVVLGGEITTTAEVDYEAAVKRVASKLGYKVDKIINLIGKQSPQINNAVCGGSTLTAGDQGMMFGYAYGSTDSFLPYGFELANEIIKKIENDVQGNPGTFLSGDAKCQVTEETNTHEILKVLVSVCHKEGHTLEEITEYMENLLHELLCWYGVCTNDKLMINPAGIWTIGGPTGDCGLTGRKIVCDQYGGYCAVGGGAFSGKDLSKVDRSGAYMARKIAVTLAKQWHLKWCEVQLAYAIGRAEPFSVSVRCNTPELEPRLEHYVIHRYDLTPAGIIKNLELHAGDFEKLAEGCHFFGGLLCGQ